MRKLEETLLHFVGIGGIGMSGIAEVFLNQGYRVSGSDLAESEVTRRLAQLGAKIVIGHRAENVRDTQVVVVSSAIRLNNPEIVEARRLGIPVIQRAEMLGELMRGKTGIAVGGTHGKTTTTSMLASVLTHAGLDPTLVIGGKVDALGGGAKLGQGKLVLAEADESDGSFLHLPATFAVVTNIDNDHLDYFGSLEGIEKAFIDFVGKIPFYGAAAVCADDAGVRRCLDRFTKPVVTYGLSKERDFYAATVEPRDFGVAFEVMARAKGTAKHEKLGRVQLGVPGTHNVLNALASVAVATQLEIPFERIAEGLKEYRGVRRRFDVRYQNAKEKLAIVDDYGHHPTEIAATLAAARQFWGGRIITVFQPHRFSRTLHCKEGFLSAFSQSDVLLVSDIYPAGEEPIAGVDAESLVREIQGRAPRGQEVSYVGNLESARENVTARLRAGDMVLCLGAGSITQLAERLARHVQQK